MSERMKNFLKDLEKREIISNCANLKNFYDLKESERVIYIGIDCTAESLHVGHLFSIIQMIRFVKEGFRAIILLGGATSRIGDPSDKLKERPQLEKKKIEDFTKSIENQLKRILFREKIDIKDISSKKKLSPLENFYQDKELIEKIYEVLSIKREESKEAKWEKFFDLVWPIKEDGKFTILNNKDWLDKISFVNFIDKVGRGISMNYLLAKETIKKRMKTGLSYLAFNYSLLQAYDFYHLHKNYRCNGQLGGSDQWGNLTTGLKLIRSFSPSSKTFAFTCNLLTDSKGRKYSKSDGGNKTLWLEGKKRSFIDFFSNMTDIDAVMFARKFTFLKDEEIKKLNSLNNPPKLRIIQRILLETMWFLNFGEILDKEKEQKF